MSHPKRQVLHIHGCLIQQNYPSLHLTMKSSRLHGLHVFESLLLLLMLQKSKNNHLTCMKAYLKKMEYFTISTAFCWDLSNYEHFMFKEMHEKKSWISHLTRSIYLHVLTCLSTLRLFVDRIEPQLSNTGTPAKSAKTPIEAHMPNKMMQSHMDVLAPQKTISGMFLGDYISAILVENTKQHSCHFSSTGTESCKIQVTKKRTASRKGLHVDLRK